MRQNNDANKICLARPNNMPVLLPNLICKVLPFSYASLANTIAFLVAKISSLIWQTQQLINGSDRNNSNPDEIYSLMNF